MGACRVKKDKRKKTYTLEKRIRRLNFWGCFGLIAVILAGFILISSNIYINQAMEFCDNALKMNLDNLNNRLLQIQEGQHWIAEDSQLREIIRYRNENPEVDFSIELYHQWDVLGQFQTMIRNREIDNIYIVDQDGNGLYSYKDTVYAGKLAEEEWFQEIKREARMEISYISQLHDQKYWYGGGNSGLAISMVMPIMSGGAGNQGTPQAYLIFDINLSNLLTHNTEDIQFAILDGKDQWCSIETMQGSEKIQQWAARKEDGKDVDILDLEHKTLVMSMPSETFKIRMIGVKNLSELEKLQSQLVELSILVFLLAALLSLFLSKSIMKSILRPIRRLMEKCDEVSKGNYEIAFDKEEAQEIAVLSTTIQGMIHNVVNLNQQMVEEEQKLSEEKMRVLQHQINPHFINNVLQAIKGLALQNETEKISRISTYLGKVMAYSVYRPYDTVTIKEEMNHVGNYLEIQKIRFDNSIFYTVECSEEVASVRTMKLILQPLAENAVEHGKPGKGRVFISVNADAEGERVCIIINDNGKGIEPEELEEIQEKLKYAKSYEQEKSIGLLNVNSRIKRKYGDDYGLEIQSRLGAGTTVIVKLPKEV